MIYHLQQASLNISCSMYRPEKTPCRCRQENNTINRHSRDPAHCRIVSGSEYAKIGHTVHQHRNPEISRYLITISQQKSHQHPIQSLHQVPVIYAKKGGRGDFRCQYGKIAFQPVEDHTTKQDLLRQRRNQAI